MALDEEPTWNLSSLSEIEDYIRSPDFMLMGPMEQWNVLSAIQREIDLRYVVAEGRHVSSFIDVAAYKGQLRTEALREIQREMYEVAPRFLNMDINYIGEYFVSFPTYYSPSSMNEVSAYSIERIFPDGTTPIAARDGHDATIVSYRQFLANVCYWLKKFRYVNACPYTFTLSTYDRDWVWENETDGLCSDYQPLSDCYDIWQYDLGKHERKVTKKEWDYDVDMGDSSNNGEPFSGIQVEVFQWFRTQNVNPVDFTDPKNPVGMEDFNGFPATEHGQIADNMPHRDDSWYPLSAEEVDALTAEWTQYEWELEDFTVFPRHIPFDIGDWRCYGKLSTVTGWDALEYGFSESTSARWTSAMSAGWDSVMTDQQVRDWGTTYLSAFPNRGLTGKVIGVPALSGTASKGGFFNERGHLMKYRFNVSRSSKLWQHWIDKELSAADTKLHSSEHIDMHKEGVPLSVTVENPFALSADVCYVMYSNRLPEIHDYKRDVTDFEAEYPSYPTDGLRMDVVIAQTQKSEDTNYNSTRGGDGYFKRTYYYSVFVRDENLEFEGNTQYGHYTDTRYLIDNSKSIVLEDYTMSSGIHWDSGWHILKEYYGYPDSFGLLNGNPISALSSDDFDPPDWYPKDEEQAAHVFYSAFPISAYTYEALYAHLSDDFPPIEYDLKKFYSEEEPDGPWYEGGDWGGIGNTVELTQNSEMRLFTFFDFAGAFNIDTRNDTLIG